MATVRGAQAVDPGAAQRAAQHILSDPRYRSHPAPRPLRGPLQWIGDRLGTVLRWIADVIRPVPGWLWIAVGLAVVAFVAARIVAAARRRRVSAAVGGGRAPGVAAEAAEDPDAIERAAADAERAGDFARALRLRFRAGLLRLGDRGAIEYRPSLTTSEVRRALGSSTFDELARTFEGVAYGGHAAAGADAEAARREWPHVLAEAGRR